jgi:hypothetical protein
MPGRKAGKGMGGRKASKATEICFRDMLWTKWSQYIYLQLLVMDFGITHNICKIPSRFPAISYL